MNVAEYRNIATPKAKGRFPRASRERRTHDGIVFDSRREMQRYARLKQWESAGEITRLERHPRYDLIVNGEKVGVCTWDFSYIDRKGNAVIEDVKSTGTRRLPDYRLRKRMFEAQYAAKVTEVLKP